MDQKPRVYFLDFSHFDQSVDYQMLYAKGYRIVVVKIGGGIWPDAKFTDHYAQAIAAGLRVAIYLWDDGTVDVATQCDLMFKMINGLNIAFIALDIEQWWSDWIKWQAAEDGKLSWSLVPKFTGQQISDHAYATVQYIKSHSTLGVLLYSAMWFINSYSKELLTWIMKYRLWFADYSWFTTAKQSVTWEQLLTLLPPAEHQYLVPANADVPAVQISGDKFLLPGVYSDILKTRPSAIDLSEWVKGQDDLNSFSKFIPLSPIAIPSEKLAVNATTDKQMNMTVLDVEEVSQLGTGADEHNNDCGAASGCMLVEAYTGTKPTVDQFYDKTGLTYDGFLSVGQIQTVLQSYGVATIWKAGLSQTDLYTNLAAKKPMICLILYAPLVDLGLTEDISFRGYHFVVAAGIDVNNVYINDPLWKTDGALRKIPMNVFMEAWTNAGAAGTNPICGALVPISGIGSSNTSVFQVKVNSTIGIIGRSTPQVLKTNVIEGIGNGKLLYIELVQNGWGKIAGKNEWVFMDNVVRV